ncbi:WxL domain-containing protein [Enterococcus casseliflavus]|jgi:hypothetical protein|uniref:WxL domain-containing protein n=1 Tax=Enterococcus casseliflavus TaxID=37734 RepID=UPI00076410B3|nr:WxL domain-containing protein [Enterococcus casseliflavus]OJG29157.1 hypothetical protein RU99_GL001702 [Enterococcus casseliflavus]QQU23083.1 WxL domain-containing protein [Enterococcus casseliflavus]STQ30080.1 cell surface protein [Enterococcus casseliflavus]
MKKRLFPITTFILLTGTLLGPKAVLAAEYDGPTKAVSEGTVTILENDDPDNVIPDPDDPDNPIIPDPDNPINPNPGLLRINYVSDFSFGRQFNTSAATAIHADMDTVFDGNTGEEIKRVPFISTEDRRGTDRLGWELRVSQSRPFQDNDGNELEGARVTINNLQYPNMVNAPTTTPGSIVINEEEKPVAFADERQGSGSWSLALGNPTDEGTTDGVLLEIPANTVKNNTTYSSSLVWELVADPTNVSE